ncbi:MAG: TMEM14 family protein [Verrucomicrobiota bacterium]
MISCITNRLMIAAARYYFIIFGLLTIVGGVIGYLKAGSVISVVAGGVSGILLVVAALLLPQHPVAGLILAGLVSFLLAGQFAPKFLRTGTLMPAGLMAILSVLGIVMAIAAFLRR